MELDELKKVIIEVTNNQDLCIKEDSRLNEDLGLCSFDLMMIIGIIEEEYDKKIDVCKLLNDRTIKGIIDAIL